MSRHTDFYTHEEAVAYLEAQGYTLTHPPLPAFCWQLPREGHTPTRLEDKAINYLFNEWDYGGVLGIDVKVPKCLNQQ